MLMRRTGVRYSCRSNYSTEEAYYAAPQPELDVETAIVHLVDGTTVSEFEDAFQYGYALEYICQDNAIDSWKIEGKRRLSHLKIKSVLFKNRSPVVLPEYDDFPEIGYLSTLEATKELSTVFSRGQLKLDRNANIASDREIVITAVERSVDCNQSLIGFYY